MSQDLFATRREPLRDVTCTKKKTNNSGGKSDAKLDLIELNGIDLKDIVLYHVQILRLALFGIGKL